MEITNKRLKELIDKKGNTKVEIEEMEKFNEVIDIQNVGYGGIYYSTFQQLNIIIKGSGTEEDEFFYNYILEETDEKLKPVSGFKCTDNSIFENQQIAMNHQRTIDRNIEIEDFIDEHFYNGINKDEIKDGLLEFRAELLKILR